MPQLQRILVLDDDTRFLGLMKRVLAGHFDVVTAERVSGATGIIEKNELALICSDLSLPDSDGFETIDTLLPIAGDVPLLILTGSVNHHNAKRALSMGCVGYIQKPLDINVLPERLERAIVRGQYLAQLKQESAERRAAITTLESRLSASEAKYEALMVDSNNRIAILTTDNTRLQTELTEHRKRPPARRTMSLKLQLALVAAGVTLLTGLLELLKAWLTKH